MTVNIHAAKTNLSDLVARVERGERIVIARAGRPVAQLVPAPRTRRTALPPDDPILHPDRYGFDGPGGPLPAVAADRIIYGA